MHIEILTEDASGKRLLDALLPKILGSHGEPHTWRTHSYKGVGRLPKDLSASTDPQHRILLARLPKLLKGYGKSPGIGAVVVVLDVDKRNCRDLLHDLKKLTDDCRPAPTTLFRFAIEEIEAWYFGDRQALLQAYPKAKPDILSDYTQDAICDTWEKLADAIHPGGAAAIKRADWPLPGQIKCEWAEKIGPCMDPHRNESHSFAKFRDGLRRLIGN